MAKTTLVGRVTRNRTHASKGGAREPPDVTFNLENLQREDAFARFADLPPSFSLTVTKNGPETPYFFFAKLIKRLPSLHYQREFEAEDLDGVRVHICLAVTDIHKSLLPYSWFEDPTKSTILLVNPKRATMRNGKEGIVIDTCHEVKLLSHSPRFWNEKRLKVIKVNQPEEQGICQGCGDETRATTCYECQMFKYCSRLCRARNHATECLLFQDEDLKMLFTGDWEELSWFRGQMMQ
ncbi:hypothetical protein BJX64DRAFT_289843 [Aspergillus heterothallicus]